MRRRTLTSLLVTAVMGVALTGCGSSSSPTPAPSSGNGFPVTAGGITLSQRPTHIVSLSPTATEILFAIGAGTQVVAVDDQSDYPSDAPKTDLSGYKPNAEAIAARNPDLVVISDDTNKIKEQLTELKIPVYQAPAAKTITDAYAQMTDLGALTGHLKEAGAVTGKIASGIDKLVKETPKRTKPLTYYYELDPTYYSVTSKTFIGSLLGQLGLVNIADAADKTGSGYPQLSAETIVKANPDLIFLADIRCCGQSAAAVAKRAGWSGLTAVRAGQVVALDDSVASRWGPRTIDLVQAVADAVNKVPSS
jgi:iron complex transport system substrate-binding protein